jgi:hypothetical protein
MLSQRTVSSWTELGSDVLDLLDDWAAASRAYRWQIDLDLKTIHHKDESTSNVIGLRS